MDRFFEIDLKAFSSAEYQVIFWQIQDQIVFVKLQYYSLVVFLKKNTHISCQVCAKLKSPSVSLLFRKFYRLSSSHGLMLFGLGFLESKTNVPR